MTPVINTARPFLEELDFLPDWLVVLLPGGLFAELILLVFSAELFFKEPLAGCFFRDALFFFAPLFPELAFFLTEFRFAFAADGFFLFAIFRLLEIKR